MDLFFLCPGVQPPRRPSRSPRRRGAHIVRGASGQRADNECGAVRLAVRCGSGVGSVCGSVRFGCRLLPRCARFGVRLVGVLRLLPRRTCPHPTTADVPPSPRRLRFGLRLADAPPFSLGGSLGGWRGARAPRTRATEHPRALPERPE